MARLHLLIYHRFFSKINRPASNRTLLKVGRLIILEKSRKKREEEEEEEYFIYPRLSHQAYL